MLISKQPRVFVLLSNKCNYNYLKSIGGQEEAEKNLPAAAQALSASPLWTGIPDTILVVRRGPQPLLALLGYFDEAAEARVKALSWQLEQIFPFLRYISYTQAEKDCQKLALLLLERFGRDEIQRFRFLGLPRGGLIVLGMMSYLLSLRHEQLEPPHPPEIPLVVVDDCALSGAYFGRFLERCQSRKVIFATLYSHPGLRAAIKARESQVAACLGAHDLVDHAPDLYGNEYSSWRERWLARSDDPCYWIGQPDYVCFAWNEPDTAIWNPVTEQVERGWHIVPPELCLKNRPVAGARHPDVQIQPEGKGPLKPSPGTLFADFGGQIVAANIETGACYGLSDVAAGMWRAIIKHGNPGEAETALLMDYDIDKKALHSDLHAFIKDLIDRGLLEEGDTPDT